MFGDRFCFCLTCQFDETPPGQPGEEFAARFVSHNFDIRPEGFVQELVDPRSEVLR